MSNIRNQEQTISPKKVKKEIIKSMKWKTKMK